MSSSHCLREALISASSTRNPPVCRVNSIKTRKYKEMMKMGDSSEGEDLGSMKIKVN
jgi:hypothetical protein